MGTISNGESGLSVRNKLNDVIDKIEGTTDINNAINIDGALSTDTSLNIASSTTVTGILDEDDMSSNSETKLATQQSIKAYVDAQVGTVDTLAEVLGNGNTTGGTDIVVSVDDVISLDNGTNALPSLTTTGDFNTGLYFPAADEVGITTGGTQRVKVDSTGIDVTGAITVSGTVDGRDVSADGTKLDTIETNADVTDATNVTAAGALMDSELTNIAAVKALNQGLATTDEVAFDNTSLNAIATDISDTAVDVFVYDTSKDSDGGAWRKRTQGTSWYNETLNTATRGSSKEFPAVAVIVVDNDGLYIYDGDDPDLPMWMKANDVALGMVLNTSNSNAVTAKNGIIALAGSSALWVMHFVDDRGDLRNASKRYDYKGNIEQRNDGLGYIDQETSGALVSATTNDVAMTVLPNAPIDAATGLPVPTIAVATDGGVSVIKDDGTVVDGGTSNTEWVMFDDEYLYFEHSSSSRFIKINAVTSDGFSGDDIGKQGATTNLYIHGTVTDNANDTLGNKTVAIGSSATAAGTAGLSIIQNSNDVNANSLSNLDSGYRQAAITSSYNTGWMNGDIKLATLSDTDDTDVTGSELIINGDFATDSDWTKGTGWSIAGGVGVGSSVNGTAFNSTYFTTVVGKKYTVSFDLVSRTAGTVLLYAYDTTNLGNSGAQSVAGTYSFTFTAAQTSTHVYFYSTTSFSGTVDNVTCRLAEEDRSVNGNGLQVFGTVQKNPVATGADLVAYSGFSTSNYLEQPYNSDLDFGTGDFCVMGWWKFTSDNAYDILIDRGYYTGGSYSGNGFNLISGSGNSISFRNNTTGILSIGSQPTNVWFHLCVVRKNGVFYSYINGVQQSTASNTDNFTNTNATLRVGLNQLGDVPANVSAAALWRISATAPSAEQIKKIYEDEKVLFQENAQATLYGSSDAVTALAYDDSTELLHVGTSAGRSVFQGLRRVDNTTDAVGAAISASNGLVADE